MRTIDTRDLVERREELEQQILDSFNEEFPQYEVDSYDDILFEEEGVQNWKEDWLAEIDEASEIERLQDLIGSEFEYGVTLIHDDDFEDYARDLVEDCGYISRDLPSWIEIDWEATADNIKVDYSSIELKGDTYLYRS